MGTGPGRVLIAVYGIFALSASGRAVVQIASKFTEAPLAYLLSAIAAAVYIVATVALAKGGETWRRVALVSCSIELAGVLAVGLLTVFDAAAFPDDTVWTDFGRGYGYVPLILPVIGLLWLRHAGKRRTAA
ncbi:MAG TPA: hypothetical protein VK659_29065 [Asanoa sp.]|nr:hypothetical protein [Asanoa sp.]